MKTPRTKLEMEKYISEGSGGRKVVGLSLNNKGQAFYTTFVDERFAKISITRMKKVLDSLHKNIPAESWSLTIDGQRVKGS